MEKTSTTVVAEPVSRTDSKERMDKIKKVAINAAVAAVGSILIAVGQACIANNKE